MVVLEEGYSSWTLPHQPIEDSLQSFRGVMSGAHGYQLLTSQSNINSHLAVLILVGAGIKKGYERPISKLGYIKTKDIVPTLCYILGVQPPAQCQGTIAYDIFVGHEMEREIPSIVFQEKNIDPRVEITNKERHYFSLVKKFPWE